MPPTQNQKVQSEKPSVGFHLYKYREELSRRKVQHLRLRTTKYDMTKDLISKSVPNIKTCSEEDLQAIQNQTLFKNELKEQIDRIRKLRELGIKNADPNMPSTEL